jgi:hypothetical protein
MYGQMKASIISHPFAMENNLKIIHGNIHFKIWIANKQSLKLVRERYVTIT